MKERVKMERRKTRLVRVGNVTLGYDGVTNGKIAVQSMTNTDTEIKEKTADQIKRLEDMGCDIIRFTVNTPKAAKNVEYYKSISRVPLVADIHFDYRLALESAEGGIDKIRINPGNIGTRDRVETLVRVCKEKKIPIRIGVNSGSVEKELLKKYGGATAEALAESALGHAKILEECNFFDTVISIKSSNVQTMIKANRLVAEKCDYPLHIGVTEAGTVGGGLVKSAVGIGSLLCDGIGDTLRVSLTDDPTVEIEAANKILNAIGFLERPNIVSCPTCGRTKIDLISIAKEVERRLEKMNIHKSMKIAVMGCIVNGPGEAQDADIGIAGGVGEAVLFKKGVLIRKISEKNIVDELISEIEKMI